MAISLKVSNDLGQLALQFCDDSKSKKIGVFQPYYLVTQTDGMNNWLKLKLAQNLKIAANYRFLKPNDLITQVYHILGGDYLQPLSAESQSWLLYKILGEKEFITKFKNIAAYYSDENLDKDLKRLALAQKTADLFDQYQIYRPEMIMLWNKANLQEIDLDDWQKYLWIKAKNLAGELLPDKTHMSDYILEAVKKPEQIDRLKKIMPDIYLFGLSVLTDFHIQLFHLLGQYINFSYYLLNPAPENYWIEDISKKKAAYLQNKYGDIDDYQNLGNTLLTNWGRVIQNTFWLLFKNEEMLNVYEPIPNQAFKKDSLLHIIQNEIYENLQDLERQDLTIDVINDGSISINSCYTPAREVEALYNFLVSLVDKGQEKLSPREMVVMVSNIDVYAPYINAVFNNAPYHFNFSIADESFSSNDTIAAALIALMEINNQNLTAENVLQLLDFGYIRKRFGITDLALIRKVVNAANIRFGAEGNLDDESRYVSWEYGLERIILGICMSGGEEYEIDDTTLFPLDMVEGSTAKEVISFVHFVEVLIASVKEREKDKNLTEWVKYLESLLINMIFDAGENVDEDFNLLIKQLEKYNALNNLVTQNFSFQLFGYSLLQSLTASIRSGSFAGGGITFCSLIPMRSIPFKVVALLGLNFDKFPRKEHPVDFDLMRKNPKPGDRNVKENDKHLFLETILSAQKYLYISYIGQNDKDNTTIPPSALVDELISYIQNKYPEDDLAEKLIIKHPLHHFSDKNLDFGRANYINHIENQSLEFLNPEEKKNDLELSEINVQSFVNFFKNPFKAYFNHVLKIYYEEDEVLLSDTESFGLDNLQQWSLKESLLLMEPNGFDTLKNRLVKTGGLPLKNMATVVLEQTEEIVGPIRQLFFDCIENQEEQSAPINLKFEDSQTTIIGDLTGIYGDKLVYISWSKNEMKHLLAAYLKFLIAQASGLNLQLYFISANREKIYEGVVINSAEAKNRLTEIIKLYKKGHQQILSFYPDFDLKPKSIPYMSHNDFEKALNKKFKNENHPSNDKYINIKYNEGFFDEKSEDGEFINFIAFMQNAEILLSPIADLLPDYYA